MKLRIENLATLLLIVAMLLDGCSGCEQKTQQKTTDYNRELENVRQAKLDAVYAIQKDYQLMNAVEEGSRFS